MFMTCLVYLHGGSRQSWEANLYRVTKERHWVLTMGKKVKQRRVLPTGLDGGCMASLGLERQ